MQRRGKVRAAAFLRWWLASLFLLVDLQDVPAALADANCSFQQSSSMAIYKTLASSMITHIMLKANRSVH
jgi:hypothetical protein